MSLRSEFLARRRQQRSEAEKEPLGVWSLAWPTILNNITFALAGVFAIDAVSRIAVADNTAELAAVASGTRLLFLVQAVLFALSIGTAAMISRLWGAQLRAEAARVTASATVLGMGIAILISLLLYFEAAVLISIFNLEGRANELAIEYVQISALMLPPIAVFLVLSSALRAVGDVMSPLFASLVTNVVCIVATYALTLGWWIAPALGVQGAAYGLVIGNTMGMIALIVPWIISRLDIPLSRTGWHRWERTRELISVSLPASVEGMIFNVGLLIFVFIVSFYGPVPFAAYGAGVTLLSFSIVVGIGFQIAVTTLVGQNLGANKVDEARQAMRRTMKLGVLSMGIVGAVTVFFAEELALALVKNERIAQDTKVFIWMLGAVQPAMAYEFISAGTLRGAGDTRSPMIVTTGCLVVRCLAAWIAWLLDAHVYWIYAALLFDYSCKVAFYYHRLNRREWAVPGASVPKF